MCDGGPQRITVNGIGLIERPGLPNRQVAVCLRICETEAGLLWLVGVDGMEPKKELFRHHGKAAGVYAELVGAHDDALVPTG